MTGTKRLTIALAIALPLLVVGGGLAVAANGASEPVATAPAAPSLALAPVSTGGVDNSACDGCAGQCGPYANGVAGGYLNGDCAGAGDCTGDCMRATNGNRAGCGRWATASSAVPGGCSSCDVVGLNKYPTNSPKATANA